MRPRRAWLLTVLLLLVAGPSALAQEPLAMRVEVEPFADLVRPLRGVAVTNVTVDAPCVAPNSGGGDPTRPTIALWVEEAPAWATVILSPATLAPDPMSCQMGRHVMPAQVIVSASDQAPAFAPAPVKIAATWVGATPNLTARGSADVEAGFFSILDVVLLESIKQVEPGGSVAFATTITNLGNDRVTLVFEIVQASEGLDPIAPGAFPLDSRQQGSDLYRVEVPLNVRTKSGGIGYQNEPGTVTYRIRSHHVDRPELVGDGTEITVLVTVKGFQAEAPGPGVVPLVALLALVGVAAGRRLRR